MVAWQSNLHDPPYEYEILVRKIGGGGKPRPAFQIARTAGDYYSSDVFPSASMSRAGDFLVAWEGLAKLTDTTATWDVFARAFERSGNPIDDRFRVNSRLPDNQGRVVVAATSLGGFFVVWETFYPRAASI